MISENVIETDLDGASDALSECLSGGKAALVSGIDADALAIVAAFSRGNGLGEPLVLNASELEIHDLDGTSFPPWRRELANGSRRCVVFAGIDGSAEDVECAIREVADARAFADGGTIPEGTLVLLTA